MNSCFWHNSLANWSNSFLKRNKFNFN